MKIETVKEIIKLLSKRQRSDKKERNSSYRGSAKHIRELGHKLHSETARDYEKYLAEYGYHLKGIANRLHYKIANEQKTEIRAYNLVYAYLRNKPFKSVEKEFLGDIKGYELHKIGSNEYSVFEERKYRQRIAVEKAKMILQLTKIVPVHSHITKNFLYNQTRVLDDTDFDLWLRQS